uniref:Uncharacterized protein n=1 Tax=Chrysemys picta bellii TaxID=8478 RepID=A0A8C3HP72_CHRPI
LRTASPRCPSRRPAQPLTGRPWASPGECPGLSPCGLLQAVLGKEERRFEAPIDFRKLPPNYHTEEKEQRRVGNATVYSHREINKVSRSRGVAPPPAESSKEGAGDGAEADPVLGRHVLLIPRPGLAFLIIHLRRRARPGKASDTSWPDGASLSDRRHRLLAIRDGLMEAPRPLKKAPPITQQKGRERFESVMERMLVDLCIKSCSLVFLAIKVLSLAGGKLEK